MADRIDDDVLVCRCEEVTAADIRKAIADGARDVTGVKLRTRAAWDCAREEPARYWCRRSCGRNWDFRQRRLVSPHQGRRSVRLLLEVSEV